MGMEKTGHETGVVPGVTSMSGDTSLLNSVHLQALSDLIRQGFAVSRERGLVPAGQLLPWGLP